MKTQEQKNTIIEKLKEQKNTLPKFSSFGDNNHEAIDFGIKVIEKNLSEDEIYDQERENYVESMGLQARYWLNGEISDEELLDE